MEFTVATSSNDRILTVWIFLHFPGFPRVLIISIDSKNGGRLKSEAKADLP